MVGGEGRGGFSRGALLCAAPGRVLEVRRGLLVWIQWLHLLLTGWAWAALLGDVLLAWRPLLTGQKRRPIRPALGGAASLRPGPRCLACACACARARVLVRRQPGRILGLGRVSDGSCGASASGCQPVWRLRINAPMSWVVWSRLPEAELLNIVWNSTFKA